MIPKPISRSHFRLIAVLLLTGSGCAVPVPAPPPVEPESSPVREEQPPALAEPTDVVRSVRGLLAEGRFEEADAALEAAGPDSGDASGGARIELLRGEVREAAGRTGEAAVHYLAVAGANPGTPSAVQAWNGIARLRRAAGDRLGAVRAELRAWEAAGAEGRESGAERMRREVGTLSRGELGELGIELGGTDALAFVREELRERRGREGAGAAFSVTVLAPFSGELAAFGEAFFAGAEIALAEWERPAPEGSGNGRPPVRLVRRDTRGDLLQATRAAQRTVVEDGAEAILGPLLSVTAVAAGAVAQSQGVPMLCPTATDPELAEIGDYVIPLDHAPADLVQPLAEFAVRALGARRFGVLLPNHPAAREYEHEFREAVSALGAEVVISLAFEPGERDFRRFLERLDGERLDAVYVPGSPADLESLVPQLDFYEFSHRLLGHGAWTQPQMLDPGNPALEGVVLAVTAIENPVSPLLTRLRGQVQRRTGQALTQFHVEGYRAMATLLGAVDRAGRDGECLMELVRRRRAWEPPPEADRLELIAYRDGVLGPASWAPGFDLVPKTARGNGDAAGPVPDRRADR